MFFLKIAFILCGTVLCMALAADVTIWTVSYVKGGVAFFAKPATWLVILSIAWFFALAIGCGIAFKLGVFPFFHVGSPTALSS